MCPAQIKKWYCKYRDFFKTEYKAQRASTTKHRCSHYAKSIKKNKGRKEKLNIYLTVSPESWTRAAINYNTKYTNRKPSKKINVNKWCKQTTKCTQLIADSAG